MDYIHQSSQEYGFFFSTQKQQSAAIESAAAPSYSLDGSDSNQAMKAFINAKSHIPPRFSSSGVERNRRNLGDVENVLKTRIHPRWDTDDVNRERDNKINQIDAKSCRDKSKFIDHHNGVNRASDTGRKNSTQHWIKMDDVLETSAEKGKKCRSTMLKQRRDDYLCEAENEAESYQKTHTRSITPWTSSKTTKLPLHKRSQRLRMEKEREIMRERHGLTPNSGLLSTNLAAGSEYKLRVNRDLKTRTDLLTFRQNLNISDLIEAEGRTSASGYQQKVKREQIKVEKQYQRGTAALRKHGVGSTRSNLLQTRKKREAALSRARMDEGEAIRKAQTSLPLFRRSSRIFTDLQIPAHGRQPCKREAPRHKLAWSKTCLRDGNAVDDEAGSQQQHQQDPAKRIHVLDHKNWQRRTALTEKINRSPAPQLSAVPGVSVHQIAVSRGLPDMEMSFTPRGSNGKRQNSIEEDVEIANYLAPGDIEPMYSSFSCDNVFREPVYLQPAAPHRHVRRQPTKLFQSRAEIVRTTPSTYENVPLHVVRQRWKSLQTISTQAVAVGIVDGRSSQSVQLQGAQIVLGGREHDEATGNGSLIEWHILSGQWNASTPHQFLLCWCYSKRRFPEVPRCYVGAEGGD